MLYSLTVCKVGTEPPVELRTETSYFSRHTQQQCRIKRLNR
uniref:Uncharacterized protein n=1 Tax=Anguilla anguilla TaxID=7936 RepID=A0A0E9UYX2_ANGAN